MPDSRVTSLLIILAIILPFNSQATEAPHYNQISFSTSAETEISNDLLVIVMSAKSIGGDLQQLSDDVNKNMRRAVDLTRKFPAVKYQTLNYSTSPRYNKGKQDGWQVSQSLKLSGTDVSSITQLMGKLQKQLHTDSVGYQITPLQRENIEQKLTTEALQKFSRQAERISKDLNSSSYKIVSVNINSNRQPGPRPMMAMSRMVSAADSITPPAIEAGSQTVKINISGTIELIF